MQLEWTDEEEAEISRMLASGQTRRQIAAHFGVTKSAICGKVYRMKKQEAPAMPHDCSDAEKIKPRSALLQHELESLRWFAEHGPTPGLDVTTVPGGLHIFPTAKMRDRLLAIGMVERRAPLGMYLYEVSEAGRAALAAADLASDAGQGAGT